MFNDSFMTRLYITRHGQTVWNKEKRIQGWLDSPLTEQGIRHAELLRDRLKGIRFEAIYSSPSQRALTTAGILNPDHININISNDLHEMNFGSWEGRQFEEIKKEDPVAYDNFWKVPGKDDTLHNDKETIAEVQERAIRGITDIIRVHTGNVLIVTHTILILSLLSFLYKTAPGNIWDLPPIRETSLTVIDFSSISKYNILMAGDISHLE